VSTRGEPGQPVTETPRWTGIAAIIVALLLAAFWLFAGSREPTMAAMLITGVTLAVPAVAALTRQRWARWGLLVAALVHIGATTVLLVLPAIEASRQLQHSPPEPLTEMNYGPALAAHGLASLGNTLALGFSSVFVLAGIGLIFAALRGGIARRLGPSPQP
jgi:hypothetical protein